MQNIECERGAGGQCPATRRGHPLRCLAWRARRDDESTRKGVSTIKTRWLIDSERDNIIHLGCPSQLREMVYWPLGAWEDNRVQLAHKWLTSVDI